MITSDAAALAATDGRHSTAEGGLSLNVRGGARNWYYREKLPGQPRKDHALGSIRDVPLDMAIKLVGLIRRGEALPSSPRERRKATKRAEALVAPGAVLGPPVADIADWTFREAATTFIAMSRKEWRGDKQAAIWEASLRQHVYPTLGHVRVREITLRHVCDTLEPIWSTKAETADRLRGRIVAVVRNWWFRQGVTDRGDVAPKKAVETTLATKHVIPSTREVSVKAAAQGRRGGQKAPTFETLAKLLGWIWGSPCTSGDIVAFTALTASRVGMVLGARWSEIDADMTVWTIPGERMKAGVEHRVPLTADMVALLERQPGATVRTGWIFRGVQGKPLSNAAPLELIKDWADREKVPRFTVHGLRATFKTWSLDAQVDWFTSEACLAHTIQDKAARAYVGRTDLKREREALERWCEALRIEAAEAALA